jgi:hypothetical protein
LERHSRSRERGGRETPRSAGSEIGRGALGDDLLETCARARAVHDLVIARDRLRVGAAPGEQIAPRHVGVHEIDGELHLVVGGGLGDGAPLRVRLVAAGARIAAHVRDDLVELRQALIHQLDAQRRALDDGGIAFDGAHARAHVEADAAIDAEPAISLRLLSRRHLLLQIGQRRAQLGHESAGVRRRSAAAVASRDHRHILMSRSSISRAAVKTRALAA